MGKDSAIKGPWILEFFWFFILFYFILFFIFYFFFIIFYFLLLLFFFCYCYFPFYRRDNFVTSCLLSFIPSAVWNGACSKSIITWICKELHIPLRKHAYSNTMKISPPKTENFQIKISDIFLISAQNIDCGYSLEPPYRGGSNEYPQSMFWTEIRKIMYTPVNPSFTIYKSGV